MSTENLSLPEGQESSDTNLIRRQFLSALSASAEYRHSVVEESIKMWITSQIKSLRDNRDEPWDYKAFADKLGKKISWAYRLEDPNEAHPTIPTLLQVARAFDVALEIRFVSFSKFLNDSTTLNSRSFFVPSFGEDPELSTAPRKEPTLATVTTGASYSFFPATVGVYKLFNTPASSMISSQATVPHNAASTRPNSPWLSVGA